jgi:poly(A) polymerase
MSDAALKVLSRLDRAGHQAYLVGGAVRDLLLGGRPKDFDIVTDARPEQMRRLFRNSRIIGRRFRLVHVVFGNEIVEVATFRRDPDPRRQRGGADDLLVTSDNTYGTPREDAFRRDFTVNALFYRIHDFSVVDYVGGLDDLDRRVIRVIGDPAVRYQEDPVRMLRACEFAGRLSFEIERGTLEAIREHRREIHKAAPARLVEELLQLLGCGRAEPAFEWASESGLLESLIPEARDILEGRGRGVGFARLFGVLDRWRHEGAEPSEGFRIAALLAPSVINRRLRLERRRVLSRLEVQEIASTAIASLMSRFALSAVRRDRVYDILETLQRLCEPMPESDRAAWALCWRPVFREALDLFELLREASDGGGAEIVEAWRERAKQAPPAPRSARPTAKPKRRRTRRRR